jgi:PAS domain S-box-containing protein/putative nucleotidyltransferase with HDIG domain
MEQMAMNRELRVLMLEDTLSDAELAEHELRKAGIAFTSKRVETRDAFIRALEEFRPDIVLSDYKLPTFNGMDALEIVQRNHSDVPVVMVTGALTDIEAVDLIHAGARDYVLKDRLARLASAVQRALYAEQGARARKAAEMALQESEARYRRITEGLTDYQYTVRIENGHAAETTQSQGSVVVTGYKPEEFVANPNLWIQMVAQEDRELVTKQVGQILTGKDVPPMEYRIIRKDGETRWVSDTTILFKDASGKLLSYDGVIKDITERKELETQLKQSVAYTRSLIEASLDPLVTISTEGKITDVNQATEAVTGKNRSELIGTDFSDYFTMPERAREGYQQVFLNGAITDYSLALRHRDGHVTDVLYNATVYRNEAGEVLGVFAAARDVTERNKAETALRESEALLQATMKILPVGLWVIDGEGRIVFSNDEAKQIWAGVRYVGIEHLGEYKGWRLDNGKPIGSHEWAGARAIEKGETSIEEEIEIECFDGTRKIILDSAVPLHKSDGSIRGAVTINHDITDRKHAEIALNHANRALATVSAVNRQLVYAADENELLQSICQAIVEQRGYQMAWVGYAQQDADKTIKMIAHAGYDEGYLDDVRLTWADSERGMGPSGRAIRIGTTQLCQDIANDPLLLPWRDASLQRGYAANIALPLAEGDGKVFGILAVYADEVNAFSQDEVDLLEEMAGDLAFGVRTLHTRHERDLALEQSQHYLAQLQDSLEDTVRAIAGIVELRDPYTAGHQIRVADLATAIARQIGLPDEQVHAIHLAGIVHDLGKIKIPAEILSKPGLLSDIEFQFIKTHAQAGYDILKDINFIWPIAQIVLQHHERLDGSGYPQGLKGDAIMFEVRILSVADVVEAMSSHRPYRPAMGIEAALEEIARQRGIRFDPKVVDVCLSLFRDKGFAFKA